MNKILCPPLWEKIFSVTNFYDYGTKHKQIKLFGIRIKIKLTTKQLKKEKAIINKIKVSSHYSDFLI